uniref:S24 family peptidase n=1 Tax=Ningiella ruwaisensis TaxID=2364274 RepID=UPI001F4FE61B|nr:helix-turn-helix transcriptional regulator [Ningiella ruwaisensis]
MDVKDIRLQNMLYLIKTETNGDQTLFSEKVDLQPAEISQIKNKSSKRNIGPKVARRIEAAFDKPKYWLDKDHSGNFYDLHAHSLSAHSQIGVVNVWDSSTPLSDNEVEVPYYMEVELAAGSGFDAMTEVKGPTLRFNKGFLRRKGVAIENAACVKVSGNSMEPRLNSGDVVAIDRGNTKIVDGDTYAINHDGLLRIKRLYLLPGGGLRINSFNSEEYPDENLSAKERELVKVIGRVFHSISDW